MLLDFILLVLVLSIVWGAMDLWLLRQSIQWKLNIGVAFFFSLIHFAWNVQGGYEMTYVFSPLIIFIAFYYLAVGYQKLKKANLFGVNRNNTTPTPLPEGTEVKVEDTKSNPQN